MKLNIKNLIILLLLFSIFLKIYLKKYKSICIKEKYNNLNYVEIFEF